MARLIGPSEASREVKTIVATNGSTKGLFKSKATRPATFYLDQAATQLADILLANGSPVVDSTVTIDAYSMLPLIQYPDGVDTLYVVVDGGPAWPVYAREDDQFDALEVRLTAVEAGGSGDALVVHKAGAETLTGVKTFSAEPVVPTPTVGTSPATKTYVDSGVAAVATAAAADATSKANAAQAAAVQRANHTGTQSADTVVDGTTNKAYTAAEKTKLAGVATGATANSADATLLARANHTGTQSADTLTDGTTNKAFLATERTKLAGVATGATANSTDAQLRDRSTHTGAQATSTVTGLDAALAGRPDLNWIVVTDSIWGVDPFGTNPKAALAAATAGQTVYFPEGTYTAPSGVGNGYTVVADNVTVVGGPGVTINVSTWGQPGIDCFNRSGVRVGGGLTVAYTGTRGNHTGSSYRGSAPYVNGCGVYFNRDRCTVDGLRTIGMPVGVFASSYNGTGSTDRMGVGNTIRNLECQGADFGILWVGQQAFRVKGLYVHDDIDDSSGANPTHAYYGSGAAALGAVDVVIDDVVAENILGGQAFQFKYGVGVRLNNHVAKNCKGLINLIDVFDLQWTNMGGVDILANGGQGAITVQKTTATAARCQLNDTVLKMATGVDERAVRLDLADSEVNNMLLVTSRPVAPANPSDYEFIITGADTRVKGLTIRSRGAGHVRAILSGIAGTDSPDMLFENFVCEQTVGLVDVSAASTGVRLDYNPGAQQGILSGSLYIGTLGGSADYAVSRREYERTVALAVGSTTATPNPYLETRTYVTVTDSSSVTIAAPAGGTPNIGTTLAVVVANNSGGTMGTVTWNAAYTLLASYVKPAAGSATYHQFRHNGTSWVEMAPPLAAQPMFSATGLAGAVTPSRFVGGTTAGAPSTGTFAVNDFVVSSDGNVYVCTVAGTPGTWVTIGTPASLNALAADALTTGEVVPRRDKIATNAVGTVSGTMYLTYFTADKSETINTLTAWTGTVAAAATPTLCRMGVYSVAANGDLTALVASTPSDTTLFAATNTAYAKATSSAWSKVVGTRYAAALLVVSGGTMPTFHGLQLTGTGVVNTLVRLAPAVIGRVAGQTDLPASVSAGSIVGYQASIAMQMS